MKQRPVYWDCDPGAERLTHEDIDEAIEAFLDESDYPQGEWPEYLTVYGYVRMETSLMAGAALEHALEELDEEHGDPDGDYTEPTELMKQAEAVFYAVILSEYTSWACEQVETREIDVQLWVQLTRPEWAQAPTEQEDTDE